MKWFKHMTDASTDEKLVEIHDEWGMWGLGVWWDLVSRVAARYNINEQPVACLNVKELCQYYSKTRRKLSEYLLHIERLRLGRAMAESWPHDEQNNLCVIEIPNVSKIKDNHQRNLQVACKSLASKEVEVEEEVEEEKETSSLSTPNESESKPSSQPGAPEPVSPPQNPSGPGPGISTVGDVAAGLMGDQGRTAAVFQDPRPVGMEHDEILNLRQLHAELFKYPINPEPVKGDLSCLILDALRAYGLSKCQIAMLGHHKEATKEGSPRGKGFENAFPAMGGQKNKLDTDKFYTLITAGQKGSGKSARSTFVAQPKLSDAEQEAAEKKRKEILKGMGIGKS